VTFFKSLYKFNRCLTNSKNYVNIVPVNCRSSALHHAAKPTFSDYLPISQEASYFMMHCQTVTYNKPFLVGLTVQELTKLHLYQGLDNISRIFGNVELISGNTDSLAVAVSCSGQEYLNKLSQLAVFFDFSNMTDNGPQFTDINRDRPGCWKIIADQITDFVAIGPSTYSYLVHDSVNLGKKSGKGISKQVLKIMKHEDFKSSHQNGSQNTFPYQSFVINPADVYATERRVTPFRSIVQNRVFQGNTSLPFGHKKVIISYAKSFK